MLRMNKPRWCRQGLCYNRRLAKQRLPGAPGLPKDPPTYLPWGGVRCSSVFVPPWRDIDAGSVFCGRMHSVDVTHDLQLRRKTYEAQLATHLQLQHRRMAGSNHGEWNKIFGTRGWPPWDGRRSHLGHSVPRWVNYLVFAAHKFGAEGDCFSGTAFHVWTLDERDQIAGKANEVWDAAELCGVCVSRESRSEIM